jgi:hypothetical protein
MAETIQRSAQSDCIGLLLLAGTLVFGPSAATAQQSPVADPPVMEIAYCGERPQKPPLKALFFNVTLHNRSDHARWFLLPRSLYEKPVVLTNSINAVEVYSAAPPSRFVLADFIGTLQLQPESAGGFQGMLLPAGANVTVRNLSVELWGEPDKPVPVRLVMTDNLTVAGSPAGQWIGVPVLSGVTTDVDVEEISRSASQSRILVDVPVALTAAEEFLVPNALTMRCPEKKPLVETPLARLAHARSVMVVRSRGSAIPFDVVKSTVEGWGRFVLVDNPDKADLLVQVATTGGDSDLSITSSVGPSLESGKVDRSTRTSKDLSSSEVSLTVLDARNRRVLWSATETAHYAMKQTARENHLVEAAEKLVSKFHDRLEPPPAAKN